MLPKKVLKEHWYSWMAVYNILKVKHSNFSNQTYKLNIVDGKLKYSNDIIVQRNNVNNIRNFFKE